jgi:hypothetical protein
MRLGDFFSPEEKLEHIRQYFKVGTVLYLFCDFTFRKKDKFLLLVRTEPEPLLLFINGDPIHQMIARNPKLNRCQVPVTPTDYPDFLTKNSHIDCTELVERFDLNEIERQVLADVSRIKGTFERPTMQAVKKALQQDVRIVRDKKRTILAEFQKLGL